MAPGTNRLGGVTHGPTALVIIPAQVNGDPLHGSVAGKHVGLVVELHVPSVPDEHLARVAQPDRRRR